jgi:hypothetical protein
MIDYKALREEEPERMKKLPHFKDLPIGYTTEMNGDIPNFKAVDGEKVWRAKEKGLCSICGEPLDYYKAFLVTEREAETREVYENPNHVECLHHAFKVCPWMFYADSKYTDPEIVKAYGDILRFGRSHPEAAEGQQRAERLGVYICRNYLLAEKIQTAPNGISKQLWRFCKVGNAVSVTWIKGN